MRPPDPKLAEIRQNEIVYLKTLEGQERVTFGIRGSARRSTITTSVSRAGAPAPASESSCGNRGNLESVTYRNQKVLSGPNPTLSAI